MEQLQLNEKVNVKDSFGMKGILTVTKDDGTVLFKCENMIVKSGRKFIMGAITGKRTLTIDKIFLGSSSTVVTEDDVYDATGKSETDVTTVVDTESLTLTVTASISGENMIVRDAGLLLSDGTLFSRLLTRPVTLKSTSSYKLTYVIYF